jgi:hypothetical protein
MPHVTLAASERAFQEVFTLVRDNFSFFKSETVAFGSFSANYSVGAKLSGGTVDLRSDGTVEINHVDIIWNPLKIKVCLDLPGFTIPGFCIIPDPWNGCLVGIPDIPIGGQVCLKLNLSGLVSEINSVRAHLNPVYFVDPLRNAAWSDLEAELNGRPNKWRIFIDPDTISIDLIDVPASVGNLFENLIESAVEDMLPGWLPGWAKDIIMSGLYEFIDPYPMLPASGGLFRVGIPIRNLRVDVNDVEMIVTADVGA